MEYTKLELEMHVRVEQLGLRQEKAKLQRRLDWINHRLTELDKADALLEGM